jgi:hypothetical protein
VGGMARDERGELLGVSVSCCWAWEARAWHARVDLPRGVDEAVAGRHAAGRQARVCGVAGAVFQVARVELEPCAR